MDKYYNELMQILLETSFFSDESLGIKNDIKFQKKIETSNEKIEYCKCKKHTVINENVIKEIR